MRRISLDCEPLYRDSAVLDAFAAMMADPSRANHAAFRSLVAAGRPESAAGEVRKHGRDLAPTTALIANRADVVAQEDDSQLAADAPAILAWIVAGAAAYCQAGLREPDVVAAATAAYARDSDTVGRFVDEMPPDAWRQCQGGDHGPA